MDVELFITQGLGDNSYLLTSGNEAALVDPQRDIWRFTKVLEQKNLKLKYIIETHVHNDYISGALELKDRYRNVLLALPKKGDYEFEHKGVSEGDRLTLDKVNLQVLDTPGHTYEHISWIASKNNEAFGAFTGGSLIIGSAGRTDLLGKDHVEQLTKFQYESVNKMKNYPKEMYIYPTHGAGSFCTTTNTSKIRISKLNDELFSNQALKATSLDDFFDRQLRGLKLYPKYYPEMAPINRRGPKVYRKIPPIEPLSIEQFEERSQNNIVIDLRTGKEFARAHIHGSYNFEYKVSSASYIGWIIPFNSPYLIVPGEDENSVDEIAAQLFRIGYEQPLGYLENGFKSWVNEGKPVNSYESMSIESFKELQIQDKSILDVRQPVEFEEFNLPNFENIFVADLVKSEKLDKSNYFVICGSGQRAAIAASLVSLKGKEVTVVYGGGTNDLRL